MCDNLIKMYQRKKQILTFSSEAVTRKLENLTFIPISKWENDDFKFLYHLYYNKDNLLVYEDEN